MGFGDCILADDKVETTFQTWKVLMNRKEN